MKVFLISALSVICFLIIVSNTQTGLAAVLLVMAITVFAVYLIKKEEFDQQFLLNIFLAALAVRMMLAYAIDVYDLQFFFAPDSLTYDLRGFEILQYYQSGGIGAAAAFSRAESTSMYYIVAVIYFLTGRNPLNIQLVNAVFGAGTVVLMYITSAHIFRNKRVARLTAVFAAFFPSLILWSSLGLKDGFVIFLVSLCAFLTLKLNEKFNIYYVALLAGSVVSILSLRFYIFFMLVSAIVGSFVLNRELSFNKLAARIFAIVLIGLSLTYFGALQTAQQRLERFDSLEKAQQVRENMASAADSSFIGATDVSTVSGLLTTLPVGIVYMMLSPFPWEIENTRQLLTLPEMLVWWASIPLFFVGLFYAVKKNLSRSMFVLIFTFMLTLSYATFQGNVGTAYRHRAQVQIFYFVLISVGIVVLKEYFENKRAVIMASNRQFTSRTRDSKQLHVAN